MKCPRCGFEQHIGAMFCPNCGWLLSPREISEDFWRLEDNTPERRAVRSGLKRRKRPAGKLQASASEAEPEGTGEAIPPSLKPAVEGSTVPAESGQIAIEETAPREAREGAAQLADGFTVTLTPRKNRQTFVGEPTTEEAENARRAEPDLMLPSIASPQVPAALGAGQIVVRPQRERDTSRYLVAAAALAAGMLIGSFAMFAFGPRKTEFVPLEPVPTPPAQARAQPIGGLLPVPVPRSSPGPLLASGPDQSTQNDLRNALIAEKKYFAKNGRYTAAIDELAKLAPEVVWEPGVTPSRSGVVAVMVCGGEEPGSPLLLQALSPSGRFYGILDIPTGPASGVYYALSEKSFSCPSSVPPEPPWMRSLAGWGIQLPTVTEPESGLSRTPEPSPPSDAEILGGPAPSPPTDTGALPHPELTPSF